MEANKEPVSFPMNTEIAKMVALEEIDIARQAVEGMVKAHDNLGRDELLEFAYQISESANIRLSEDKRLSIVKRRRLEHFALLGSSLANALELSDEFADKTGIVDEKPFVIASVHILPHLHEYIALNEPEHDNSQDLIRTFLIDSISSEDTQTDYSLLPIISPRRAKSQHTIVYSDDIDSPTHESSPKILARGRTDLMPEFKPPQSVIEKLDRELLVPLAIKIRNENLRLSDLVSAIMRDSPEDKGRLVKYIIKCFGNLDTNDSRSLFNDAKAISKIKAYIHLGGGDRALDIISGKKSPNIGDRDLVSNRIESAWSKIPIITTRIGWI